MKNNMIIVDNKEISKEEFEKLITDPKYKLKKLKEGVYKKLERLNG